MKMKINILIKCNDTILLNKLLHENEIIRRKFSNQKQQFSLKSSPTFYYLTRVFCIFKMNSRFLIQNNALSSKKLTTVLRKTKIQVILLIFFIIQASNNLFH